MLEKKLFKNAEEAEESIMEYEKEYLKVRHKLSKGEEVAGDVDQYNKWIILPRDFGKCIITVDDSSEVIELSRENVIVVFVPVGASHSLEALSDLSYLVLKDGLD